MMAKFARVKPMHHGALAAHPVGEQSHRNAQQERRERWGGVDQPKEIAAVTGVDDIQVEEQVPAGKEQPVQEERQQEQPGRAVQDAELGS